MSTSPPQGKPAVPTSNYVSHYDPAKSHHRAWLQAVLDRLVQQDPAALQEGSELRDLWKVAVETKAAASPLHSAAAGGNSTPAASITEIPPAVAVALPLVKEFEGCRLSAYPDPESGAEPWTIGWGSTTYPGGKPVQAGDRPAHPRLAGAEREPAGGAALVHLQLRRWLVWRAGVHDAHQAAAGR